MGHVFFGGFKSFRPSGAGVAPRLNTGAENWDILKLPKSIIVGALWFCQGLLSIRIPCFFQSDKKLWSYGP